LFFCVALFGFDAGFKAQGEELTQAKDKNAKDNTLILDAILEKIEKRYIGSGFSAEFKQQSTITAMEITDDASGKLFVKRPGKMRWEYVLPEAQIIISDSNDLWIHRPADNQVMIGKAPSFFADGKGATFLSDVKNLRKEFIITFEGSDKKGNPVAKLVPKKKSTQLTEIHLTISSETDTIDQIVTKNEYGDETRIQISKYRFKQELAEELFIFEIPGGADVLQLDP
jgi:outer membrane lipoprotein carrier protein